MSAASTGCDNAAELHRTSRLPECGFEISFRMFGSRREGQLLRIVGEKFSVGSAPGCSLSLRSEQVAPLHLIGVHGPEGTLVRAFSPDTRLDGRTISDAWINVGDRLSIGPIDLEVEQLLTPYGEVARDREARFDASASIATLSDADLSASIAAAVRAVRLTEHTRLRRLIEQLRVRRIESVRSESTSVVAAAEAPSLPVDVRASETDSLVDSFDRPVTADLLSVHSTPEQVDDVASCFPTEIAPAFVRQGSIDEATDRFFGASEAPAPEAESPLWNGEPEANAEHEATGRSEALSNVSDAYRSMVADEPTAEPLFATTGLIDEEPTDPFASLDNDDYFGSRQDDVASGYAPAPETTPSAEDDALARIRASLASLLAERTKQPLAASDDAAEQLVDRYGEADSSLAIERAFVPEVAPSSVETESSEGSTESMSAFGVAWASEGAATSEASDPYRSETETPGDFGPVIEPSVASNDDHPFAELYRRLRETEEGGEAAEESISAESISTESSDIEPAVVDEVPASMDRAVPAVSQPAEPETTPVASRSSAATASTGADDDEESIDAYMAKLLARVSGGPETSSEPTKESGSSGAAGSKETESLLRSTFASELKARDEEFRSVDYVPRLAPEKIEDLKTLRDVANAHSAVAIDTSNRKRNASSSLLWVGGSVIGVVLGGLLLKTSTSPLSMSFFLSIASFGGTIFSIRQVMSLRKGNSMRRLEPVEID
ncbi:MAG TPA: hypothetical protein PLI18_05040 [Pirellulaceae bacterium]|nr:hypothetical protein [Pirellulaceae bacterium]